MRSADQRHEEFAEFALFAADVQERLYRTAYMLCGDTEGARELTQATLARLFQAWPWADGKDGSDTYARRTLLNAFLDEPHRKRPENQPDGSTLQPERGNPEVLELRAALMAALARLPAKHRAVLVLRHFEDLTVQETADLLGYSAADVESCTSQGLAELQDLVTQDHCEMSGSETTDSLTPEASLRIQLAAAADGIILSDDLVPFANDDDTVTGS